MWILDVLHSADLAFTINEVIRLISEFSVILNLSVHNDYQCLHCNFCSTNADSIRQHCKCTHKKEVLRGLRWEKRESHDDLFINTNEENSPLLYCAVKLQTLWTEKKQIQYFEMHLYGSTTTTVPSLDASSSSEDEDERDVARHQDKREKKRSTVVITEWKMMKKRYWAAQHLCKTGWYITVEGATHISEITSWLKSTEFAAHLTSTEIAELSPFYSLSDAMWAQQNEKKEETTLMSICDSVKWVLHKAMLTMQNSHSNAQWLSWCNIKLLNIFCAVEMLQKLIQLLQTHKAQNWYIATWQKLICYFTHVTKEQCLHRDLFCLIETQLNQFEVMKVVTDVLAHSREDAQENGVDEFSDGKASSEEGEDWGGRGDRTKEKEKKEEEEGWADGNEREKREGEEQTKQNQLNEEMMKFSLALIQQCLSEQVFNSSMIFFITILAWDVDINSWMKISNYISYLLQLIYDSQLMILQHYLDCVETGESTDMSDCIVKMQNHWLLNDSSGPMKKLHFFCLLDSAIMKNTINQVQVHWYEKEDTLVYNEIQFTLSDLAKLMQTKTETAEHILKQNLCFDLLTMLMYSILALVNNWDVSQLRKSFLTDSCNQDILGGGGSWILNQLQLHSTLMKSLLFKDAESAWWVFSDMTDQYEQAEQHFLEHMMVLMHLKSKQPAQKLKYLDMWWCNKLSDKCNLFVHDSYVLFILTYHKFLIMTNVFHWSVHFLLPMIEQLLIHYLVLIQPFHIWLKTEVIISENVFKYLWSLGVKVWTENQMTKMLTSEIKVMLSICINVQSWCQMMVRIVIKKFGRLKYPIETDLANNDNDRESDLKEITMLDVFHWQVFHTSHTGNQIYGGTVNFQHDLMDAGLQKFWWTSQLWHDLCTPELEKEEKMQQCRSHKHQCENFILSLELGQSLVKRVVFHKATPQHWQHWIMTEMQLILEVLYSSEAHYWTSKQINVMQMILNGVEQVVTILGTDKKKSLLYMLLSRLAGAETMVVILLLISLKQNMIHHCKKICLDYKVWEATEKREGGMVSCALMFMSVKQTMSSTFHKYLNHLKTDNTLNCVMFNESHLVLTASKYHLKMGLIHNLQALHCQFLFLMVILPSQMIQPFEQMLLLLQSFIIHSHTFCANLNYIIHTSNDADLQWFIINQIYWILKEQHFCIEKSRMHFIVYTVTQTEVTAVTEQLRCQCYYLNLGDSAEKAVTLAAWIVGTPLWMMVTISIFRLEIDYLHVWLIVHLEPSQSTIDFMQKTDWLRWDSKRDTFLTYLLCEWTLTDKVNSTEKLFSEKNKIMQQYLNHSWCQKQPLSGFLDGEKKQACHNKKRLCDQCHKLGMVKMEGNSPSEQKKARTRMVGGEKESRNSDENDGDDGDLREAEDRGGNENLSSSNKSSKESNQKNLKAGGQLLWQHIHNIKHGLQCYTVNLELLKNSCLICWLLSDDCADTEAEEVTMHVLEACWFINKHHFFEVKCQAMQREQCCFLSGQGRHTGWLTKYTACFECDNSQNVCMRQGQEMGQCKYHNIVMPACWTIFQWEIWCKHTLLGLAGQAFSEKKEYMLWLEEMKKMHGQQVCNLMYITDNVMTDLIGSM